MSVSGTETTQQCSAPKNRGNSDTCHSVHGLGGHYTLWAEGSHPQNTQTAMILQGGPWSTQVHGDGEGMVLARGWGERNGTSVHPGMPALRAPHSRAQTENLPVHSDSQFCTQKYSSKENTPCCGLANQSQT